VFLAQNKASKEFVAVKIIPKKILINNKELAREVRILTNLDHPNIVKLYDVFLTNEHLQV
jgi:calcium-dependent protein kinase